MNLRGKIVEFLDNNPDLSNEAKAERIVIIALTHQFENLNRQLEEIHREDQYETIRQRLACGN